MRFEMKKIQKDNASLVLQRPVTRLMFCVFLMMKDSLSAGYFEELIDELRRRGSSG